MRNYSFWLCLFFIGKMNISCAQKIGYEFNATKTNQKIYIDGEMQETDWQQAEVINHFTAAEPISDKPSIKQTEVRFLYDDDYLYIAATLFDNMDSITSLLTERDNTIYVTDNFFIYIDTYQDAQNAYAFGVSSKGVQEDSRQMNQNIDFSWDAVWYSEVKWYQDRWIVEMKIPYAALRFDKKDVQNWNVNFSREIRRNREVSYWVPRDILNVNFLEQFGTVKNIQNISPPLRLSLRPYFGAYAIRTNKKTDTQFKLGADIKWGINESYTLDMILIPDFGQVKSDALIENLGPYEVRYEENRPFFTEGSEYFNKHLDIFYTRRIGEHSSYYADRNGDNTLSNIEEVPIINALKITGKNKNGIGVGLYNAVTGNAFGIDSMQNKVLAEPATIYNVFVIEKSLKNSGNLSFINSHVHRSHDGNNANVSGLAQTLISKKGFFLETYAYLSDVTLKNNYRVQDVLGTHYLILGGKRNGKYLFNVLHEAISPLYNNRDLGYLLRSDHRITQAEFIFNDAKPNKTFQSRNFFHSATWKSLYDTKKFTDFFVYLNYFMILKWKYFGYSLSSEFHPVGRRDYDEPRTYDGRYYKVPVTTNIKGFITSDYRKKIAIDASYQWIKWLGEKNRNKHEWMLNVLLRPSNKFYLQPNFYYAFYSNQRAYATMNSAKPIFGQRNVYNVTNSIYATYNFNPKWNITCNARHYWFHVDYSQFFDLNDDGTLSKNNFNSSYFDQSYSINFISFDLVASWMFAPGSQLSLAWKNNINDRMVTSDINYWKNFEKTLGEEQTNILSLRFMYYLDVNKWKPKKIKNEI